LLTSVKKYGGGVWMPMGKDLMLFQPKKIGDMTVKNRIVRSATYEGMAKDGIVDERYVDLYRRLAMGEVGLIVGGFAFVKRNGIGTRYQTGIHSDECIPMLRKATEAVHEVDEDVKFVLQIAHCGRQRTGCKEYGEIVAPSAVGYISYGKKEDIKIVPREMTLAEVEEIARFFVAAAERAKRAGFDGVQLHAAHGYLLSEFLSPYTNRRTDAYGGSTENRVRIILEILDGIRERCGKGWPVLIKLQVDDFLNVEPSLKMPESVEIARTVAEAGIDAIEISGGIYESQIQITSKTKINTPEDEAYFLPYARRIKKVIGETPLILVGGIRSLEVAEGTLTKGEADFVSMSRPLIREPDLPKKWRKNLSHKADCISCNRCFLESRDKGLRCFALEKGEG
jgi:2,4-dienoyl-CoA reductase-like NADH-dependent reductase (Old Yellow Enzyme family)